MCPLPVSAGDCEGNLTERIKIFSDSIVLSKMCFEYKIDIAILDEHPPPGLPGPYAWLILKKNIPAWVVLFCHCGDSKLLISLKLEIGFDQTASKWLFLCYGY